MLEINEAIDICKGLIEINTGNDQKLNDQIKILREYISNVLAISLLDKITQKP